MKNTIVITVFLLQSLIMFTAFADDCGTIPTKVDNDKVYAEVLTKSQMDLELVLISKSNYSKKNFKVTGGKGFGESNLPSCSMMESENLNWISSSIATARTFSYNHHTATYKVCEYNYRNELKAEYLICNYEVGD